MDLTNMPKLGGTLFNLSVATVQYLESYDQSTVELINTAFHSDCDSQEILECIVSELEDLCNKNIVNVRFEFNPEELVEIKQNDGIKE